MPPERNSFVFRRLCANFERQCVPEMFEKMCEHRCGCGGDCGGIAEGGELQGCPTPVGPSLTKPERRNKARSSKSRASSKTFFEGDDGDIDVDDGGSRGAGGGGAGGGGRSAEVEVISAKQILYTATPELVQELKAANTRDKQQLHASLVPHVIKSVSISANPPHGNPVKRSIRFFWRVFFSFLVGATATPSFSMFCEPSANSPVAHGRIGDLPHVPPLALLACIVAADNHGMCRAAVARLAPQSSTGTWRGAGLEGFLQPSSATAHARWVATFVAVACTASITCPSLQFFRSIGFIVATLLNTYLPRPPRGVFDDCAS
jgi:hypothetical protein